MRSVFFASTAVFLLTGGLALAAGGQGGTTTDVTVPVVKNALAADSAAAATTGGSAVNSNGNTTTDSANTDITKTLVSVGNVSLSQSTTDTHMHVTFATSGNTGSVEHILFTGSGSGGRDGRDGGGGGALITSGDASLSYANSGSSGISTVQQNAGTASLQQNSVALGSYVGSGTGFSGF